MIIKMIGKILAIPALLITSMIWLIVKVMTVLYGLCYGLMGIGVVAALILFIAYQEWANVIALIIIAVIAFAILFSGSFIQVLLEEVNSSLRKIIRA